MNECIGAAGLEGKEIISITDLVEIYSEVENRLASSVGSAIAHHAMRKELSLTEEEQELLKNVYADLIVDLRLAPSELREKISFLRREGKTSGSAFKTA